MPSRTAVAGYGPVGRAVTKELVSRGKAAVVIQRTTPRTLPKGAEFVAADLEVKEQAIRACANVDAVVCAVGIPYRSDVYTRLWPIVMGNLLAASARARARFVFADSLYLYGPQTRPLTEDMPLTTYGQKPRVRAEITRLWQEAHQAGATQCAAVRASDFYGPDVSTSVISTYCVVRLLAGKPALAPYTPDHPHDFAYVPDFARAIISLLDAPDDAYGQAWHVPNAPTQSLRDLIKLAARLIGTAPRITVLPPALAPLIGLFQPDVRELIEMRFQWDRSYRVDASKFMARFWANATPFEQGLTETIANYRAQIRTR
jgi:nucleoside-diphosphate-sugar epimerase